MASCSRFGMCMVCNVIEGKYRCPGCQVVTCSLPCSTKHKKELDCSGVRSKTEFVPIKEMNELHLLSDYRLLEELSRVTDACSRDQFKKDSRRDVPLPIHLQKLRRAVIQRNCRIYFLPRNFARRKENTTLYDWKTRKISWRLKVIFLHAEKFEFPVTRCPEDVVLEGVIDKCLTEAMCRKKELRKHFEAYKKASDDIQVLLQTEKVSGAQEKMFVLGMKKTVRENLEGKRIVEFPILYVALKGFYAADDLEDVTIGRKKSKLSSLLLSSYTMNDNANESLSEDDEKPPNNKEEDSAIAMEDSLDDALDCLDKPNVTDVLSSLYARATETGS